MHSYRKSILKKKSRNFLFFIGVSTILFFSAIVPWHLEKDFSNNLKIEKKVANATFEKKKVEKHLFLTDTNFRPHLRVFSEVSNADFILDKKKKFDYSEVMQNMKGWMQVEVDNSKNSQLIRFFDCKEAVFSYSLKSLIGKQVFIDQFFYPGIELVESFGPHLSVMKGTAENMELSLLKGNLEILGKKLKAEVDLLP